MASTLSPFLAPGCRSAPLKHPLFPSPLHTCILYSSVQAHTHVLYNIYAHIHACRRDVIRAFEVYTNHKMFQRIIKKEEEEYDDLAMTEHGSKQSTQPYMDSVHHQVLHNLSQDAAFKDPFTSERSTYTQLPFNRLWFY